MWPHDLKLGRARKYLKELEAETDTWAQVDGYAIRVHPDPEPPSYVVRAEEIRPPDKSLPLLIGDLLHNARASLEYIAYALGDVGAGGKMAPEQAERSGFPIVGDVDKDGFSGRGSDMFDSTAGHKLGVLTDDARAAIKRLQPFEQGDIWDYSDLWALNELARIDRHRFLHFGAVRNERVELDRARSRNIKVKEIEVIRGTISPDAEDSADLARVIAFPANPQEKMQMHFINGLAITLNTGGAVRSVDGDEVVRAMANVVWGVEEVFDALKKHLPE